MCIRDSAQVEIAAVHRVSTGKAEDDEHLPDAAHQNGGQCGNVVGKEVVGSSNGVCQHKMCIRDRA